MDGMRSALKALLALSILMALTSLGWAVGLLYWHLKIEKAIRTLEEGTTYSSPTSNHLFEIPPSANLTLHEAGCRALPNLIRVLDPAKELPFLVVASAHVVETMNLAPAVSKEDCDLRYQRRKEFCIYLEDSADTRKLKCDRLKEWWREHGNEVHQWWRFWSEWCGKKED